MHARKSHDLHQPERERSSAGSGATPTLTSSRKYCRWNQNATFTKPFAPHELLARVRRLLERTYGAVLPIPRATGLEGTPRPDPGTPPRLLQ